MKDALVLAAYAAAVIALLWPSSRAGQAVLAVTSGFGGVLRSGATTVTGAVTG